ncbi:MAG: AMP-binding protein, partial [Solirubrobacteraceae bacterium]
MSTHVPTQQLDGLMMRTPLLVRSILDRAEQIFGEREVVSVTADSVERSNYREVAQRAHRLASALHELGVRPGDRVATFGWNSRRHLELYLAVPSMGAVLHTLNVRLFEDDLRYIVGHAEDRVIFLDASVAEQMPRFDGVEHEVLMPDSDAARDGALDYEQLIESGDPEFAFPDLDENVAAAMCYTSGTTGRPKGVVYSHRSTALHALMTNQADSVGLRERDTVMPVVPMFHANAWGLPYAAAIAGSKLVLPGPRTAPDALARLIAAEQVTIAAAVPTIWLGISQLDPAPDLSSLDRLVGGGSAVPESLMRVFDERFGVPIIQAWGMTET